MVKIQSKVLLTAQEDHPLFVWQLLLLKSEHLFFLLNRRNTDKHYGGYMYVAGQNIIIIIQVKIIFST